MLLMLQFPFPGSPLLHGFRNYRQIWFVMSMVDWEITRVYGGGDSAQQEHTGDRARSFVPRTIVFGVGFVD